MTREPSVGTEGSRRENLPRPVKRRVDEQGHIQGLEGAAATEAPTRILTPPSDRL